MIKRTVILLFIYTAVLGSAALAQDAPDTSDAKVYRKIEEYSSKRKVTSLLHGFLLRPVITSETPVHVVPNNQPVVTYKKCEGKIIRNIFITTLDPFGYFLSDTTSYPKSYLEKGGNAIHAKTQHFIIRNQLLFHKYDQFDSLLVKESERLIRSQSYINDVAITALPAGQNSDSVDVYLRANDLWSIIPDGAASSESVNIKLSDKNLAGLGHTLSASYTQNYQNGNDAFSTYYYVPNIRNSYVNSRIYYAIDEDKNYNVGLKTERPFYSPLARWAGGIQISQQKLPGWIYKNDTTRLYLTSTYNLQDYWVAAAWQVFKGISVTDRTTKLIFSGRILNLRYLEKPAEQPELEDYYTSEMFYLSGIGISSRKYVKQSYVFRFGVTEDVPVGIKYGLVGGYQLKNHERWYWGFYHSWGNFFKFGYFGTHVEYGSFVSSSLEPEAVFSAGINYFSDLFSIGNWKFRQFVRPELIIGVNRPSYDRLTLNDGNGINGFNSNELAGTRRLMFNIQTQSYAPWNVLGFRFGPYLNFGFGMLGDDISGFSHNRVYPQFGVGVLIRNDYLIVRYLQISFAYYPTIPGNGDNVFKLNPFRTTDFGFPDFIIGKPDVIQYQ
jgi:hypothetical protein